MKIYAGLVLLLALHCHAQNVVQNPSATQTIVQPSGTSFNVNSQGSIRFADQYASGSTTAGIKEAITALGTGGGIVDARAFGCTTQTITDQVVVGSYNSVVELLLNPCTQFVVNAYNLPHFVTTLAANLSSGSTTVSVVSGLGIVNGDYIQIDSEVMQVNGGGGTTTLTVTRGSSPTSHSQGASVTALASLSSGITSTLQTSISISVANIVYTNDYIQIDSEVMLVTAGGGTTSLTVTRGQRGTTATTHSSGALVSDLTGDAFVVGPGSSIKSEGVTGGNRALPSPNTQATILVGPSARMRCLVAPLFRDGTGETFAIQGLDISGDINATGYVREALVCVEGVGINSVVRDIYTSYCYAPSALHVVAGLNRTTGDILFDNDNWDCTGQSTGPVVNIETFNLSQVTGISFIHNQIQHSGVIGNGINGQPLLRVAGNSMGGNIQSIYFRDQMIENYYKDATHYVTQNAAIVLSYVSHLVIDGLSATGPAPAITTPGQPAAISLSTGGDNVEIRNVNGAVWSGTAILNNYLSNALISGPHLGDYFYSSPEYFDQVFLNSFSFANLGAPANGALRYCSDCKIASACSGGGTGALAKGLNGAWVCN